MKRSLLLLLLAALAAVGCTNSSYCLDCLDATVRLDGGRSDALADGLSREGGSPAGDASAGSDGCTPGAMELCNGVDDNCDGVADEGFDLSADPRNCGACGRLCSIPNAAARCAQGRCVLPPGGCEFGWYDLDGDPVNGCEYRCVPVPGTSNDVTCNNRDDNCNGRVDEDVDLCGDPAHCGSCGRSCHLPHASTQRCARVSGGAGACDESSTRCEVLRCDAGYYDLDGDPSNGCEYTCAPTGPERCDGVDNDCNGVVDDGDPESGARCGSTVGACTQGTQHCRTGRLQCEGGVSPSAERCDGVDNDCNGVVDDGSLAADTRLAQPCGPPDVGDCDAGRTVCVAGMVTCLGGVRPTTELCDGRDNDCDGVVDNGNPGGGGACGSAVGACRAGVSSCVAGALRCVGSTGPIAELCNGADDDCNGLVDDGFDLQNDAANCGVCGRTCAAPSATARCVAGACAIVSCLPGFVDRDRNPANGCEYACAVTSPVEVCNGLDDDCNGLVDDALTPPPNLCRSGGACGTPGPTATCGGSSGWRCGYPATVDVDPLTGHPAAVETRCDGADNNCNGQVDEPWGALLGRGCVLRTPGTTCDNVGVERCAADGRGTACAVSTMRTPGAELCNNVDDDCDGATDETALAPGGDPRFVQQQWALLRPSQSCGLIPSAGSQQARCAATDPNCNTADTTQCRAGYWCDASAASPLNFLTNTSGPAACRPYFWIMQYEASAPNASPTDRGSVLNASTPATTNRACSLPGVLPWTSLLPADAEAACAALGAALCTEGQWQAACEARPVGATATTQCVFGFEAACATWSPMGCNGLDFDFDLAAPGDQDGLLVTGSPRTSSCAALWSGYTGAAPVFDLSGNARELARPRSGSATYWSLRGGSYTTPQGGLRCDDAWSTADGAYFFPNTGFRCCYVGATPP